MKRIAMLASAVVVVAKIASLRTGMTKAVTVDETAGVIKNAAIMTVGPATGVGFNASLDATSLAQLCDLINAEPDGVKVHFQHPVINADGQMEEQLGEMLGRLKNCRIEDNTVRGDVFFGEYAAKMPGKGDVRAYLMGRAKEDPTSLGLSAVFAYDLEPVSEGKGGMPNKLVARISKVLQVDFVGKPASNKRGLLADATPIIEITPLSVLQSVSAAAQACIVDARACIDAAAALSPTADSMAALIASANRAAAASQAVTIAARVCIDHCNGLPRGAMTDGDTATAASAAVRMARLCRDTCSLCLDAVSSLGWGTSDLARACAGASPFLRTCRETIWQVLDVAGPLTAPMAMMAAKRMADADAKPFALLRK